MADRTAPHVRLAMLGAQLSTHLEVEMTPRGLRVRNPQVAGCCDEQPTAGDTISCRPRGEDDDRMYFFTAWGEPIAPVDRIADAKAAVLGYLGCYPETVDACYRPGRRL